ncbi:mediator complex subunit Med5-domain-containing protein [Crassisporium funariophilum]|nr:mediator complex subunit Med5-domain-containing protein [Crassisporium funariophilum]
MSLAELTRNAFQSGISATKWLGLCKLLIAKTPAIQGSDTIASNLSNSVLVLYRSYPGDPGLQEYLKVAIQDGTLPVSTFVATLLQAARSSELHVPATLDTLCRIALDAHYSSGQPASGSVVPLSESSTVTLGTVQDALALLRTAYSLPISHFHQLTTSVSELVILLLSCVSDLSQVSTAQALVHFGDVTDLLSNYQLAPDVRRVLDSFVVSLTLLIGDDVKAAREAQMMHTMQFALGKGDILGPSSDTDIITLGLLFNYTLTYRAHEFGAGDITNVVALLVAGFRWSSWTPPVYYTQLLVSAFTCLSQNLNSPRLWKAFIVGRLPTLLSSFADAINADNSTNADMRGALHAGLTAAFRRPDIIIQGDHALTREAASDSPPEDDSQVATYSVIAPFLQQLVKLNMITQQFASQLDPMVANDSAPKWHTEFNDSGLDLSSFLESKVMHDNKVTEAKVWVDRIWKDVSSHSVFANIVLKRFSSLVTALEVESLGHLCKILYTYDYVLDIVALHVRISDLLFYCLQFLEEYDCETVGDPQTAVSHLGDVVLFVQYALVRFKFENKDLVKNNRTVSPAFLMSSDTIYPGQDRPQEDIVSFAAWFKALFDSNSEGIEDTILRSTKPKVLLRISPALFSHAIQATSVHKIDKEILTNGVAYFTGPLLIWTLVGVIKSLVKDIQIRNYATPVHYEILASLLLSPSCPKPVLALCSPHISLLLSDKKKHHPASATFNIPAIRQVVADAIGLKGDGDSLVTTLSGGQIWYQQVQQAVQFAFKMARSHRAPHLDVQRCLKILPPIKFLQLFWTELVASANLGELEACRRIATFVLTMPQDSSIHPLLPIFMHLVLPSLIADADHQQPSEKTISVELLVAVISSALNAALHLEWAMRSVSGDDRLVLGQLSTPMARRLAVDLRRNRGSDVSNMILQRLASSQSFVANFPVFIGELGP